jgi:pyroglutamyl-peptidase I
MAVVRILVTGFEPFGGQSLNPSWEVARALHGLTLPGAQVTTVQMPCVFAQALPVLQQALATHSPDIVLALGQAEGRCDFSVERVAINVMDARIPDNAGAQPIDVPVIAGGPAAYFSTLPIKSLVAGLKAAGFPASVSQTAGTFVCNQVLRSSADRALTVRLLLAKQHFQFSVPPLMAASAKPCWRCAKSKVRACVTPAICKPAGQLGRVGPFHCAACSGSKGKCTKPLYTPSPASVCCKA